MAKCCCESLDAVYRARSNFKRRYQNAEVGTYKPMTGVLYSKYHQSSAHQRVNQASGSSFPNGAFFGTTKGTLVPFPISFALVSIAHYIHWNRKWRSKCSDYALKLQTQPRCRTGATVSLWLRLRLPEVVRGPSSRHARRCGFQVQVHTKGHGDIARPHRVARDKECPCFQVITASWKLLRRPS
jgi:hypothetical protein